MKRYALRRLGIHARKLAREMNHDPGWGHWMSTDDGARQWRSRCNKCGETIKATQCRDENEKLTPKGTIGRLGACRGPASL